MNNFEFKVMVDKTTKPVKKLTRRQRAMLRGIRPSGGYFREFVDGGWRDGKIEPLCWSRRGGPLSLTFCEQPLDLPHEWHYGRSDSGRWFSWKEKS